MNTGERSVRVQPGERGRGRRRVLAQDVQPALLGRRRHAVEAALDAADAVADEPADDADLGGDEDRRGDLGPVPLPAVQVEEEVARRTASSVTTAASTADALRAFMPRPPRDRGRDRGRPSVDGAGVAVDGDDVAVGEARRGAGEADDGRHAVLAGEDRQVAERAAGLGDQPGEARDDRRETRVEVADDEHAPGRDLDAPSWTWTGAVTVPPPAPTAPSSAPAPRRPRRAATAHGRPSSSRRKRAGRARGRRRDASSARRDRRHERRRAPQATDRSSSSSQRRSRTSSAAPEHAACDEAAAELQRRPRHQLLHPADPQAQRLAGDGRVGRGTAGAAAASTGAAATSSARPPSPPMRGGTRASTTGSRATSSSSDEAVPARAGRWRRRPARRRSRWRLRPTG